MIHLFLQTIDRYKMLEKGDRVLLAVSGGPDSVAMAHLFFEIREVRALSLFMAHLNHGLRGEESDGDESFVRDLARTLRIPLEVERRDLSSHTPEGGSVEEKAREARYRFFNRIAGERKLSKIATGHTRNDQAETLLLRLFRGAGLEGLSAISPVREGQIIRPLIDCSRDEILDYLDRGNRPFRMDSSNADRSYPRNRIRHEIIPLLQKYFNENIIESLAKTARILREEKESLIRDTETDLAQVLSLEEGKQCLKKGNLLAFSPAKIRRILRAWIREVKGDLRSVSFEHIESIIQLARKQEGRKEVSLPDSWDIILESDTLHMEVRREADPVRYAYPVEVPGEIIVPEAESKICLKILDGFDYHNDIASVRDISYNTVYFDAKNSGRKLTIRNRREGDRFHPMGSGGEKKLKDFFIDKKIPIAVRNTLPLVVKDNDILWVPGFGIHHRYRVTPETRKALVIERKAEKAEVRL